MPAYSVDTAAVADTAARTRTPPPTGGAADEHGAAAERGAGELFHRREERIHVDVENPTLIHIP